MLRDVAERTLVASGLPALARRGARGTLVLAYHNVVPDGVPLPGDRALHLPLAEFRRQMEGLRATHRVVPLDRLDRPGADPRPAAAITFDDAYASALALAVPLLVELGLPATIFVAPGLLGRDAMWWDRLASPVSGLDDADRAHALEHLRGEHDAVLAWAAAAGRPLQAPGELTRIATEHEVLEAARAPGIQLGNHTWSHPNLAVLDLDDARDELARCQDWLVARVPDTLPALAYPYGLHGPAARGAVAAAGLAEAYQIGGGWVHEGSSRTALPRLNVPSSWSPRRYVIRTSGLRLG
jgi:peptidoglycan/xylan/chitin deacetylase (PgdA/CDA1 family)